MNFGESMYLMSSTNLVNSASAKPLSSFSVHLLVPCSVLSEFSINIFQMIIEYIGNLIRLLRRNKRADHPLTKFKNPFIPVLYWFLVSLALSDGNNRVCSNWNWVRRIRATDSRWIVLAQNRFWNCLDNVWVWQIHTGLAFLMIPIKMFWTMIRFGI